MIEIHHEFLASGGKDHEAVLRQHEDLRELLEPLLLESFSGDESSPEGDASDVGGGTRTIGDYRIVGELGRGGMGVVYEAEQTSLGRCVALKVLPPSSLLDERAVARFRREAQIAANLDHPHITKVFDSGDHDGQLWIAMELVAGTPLSELLALRAGTQASDVRFAVELIAQVADALEHSHAAGIVHRDVKPANIIVQDGGNAMLADFGVARSAEAMSVTMTGDFAGTPNYASPEQLRARQNNIDHRTDIFSLGATLYELLTLQKPFDADSITELRYRIERRDPHAPSRLVRAVSRDLDSIVLRALEKDASKRYATAAAFADDLRRWQSGRPVHARPVGALVRIARWCRRNPLPAAFLLSITAALLVVLQLARVADSRLVQFQSVKLGRDIELIKLAMRSAPAAAPATAAQLHQVAGSAEDLLVQVPRLRTILADLTAEGVSTSHVEPRRLLKEHPAAAYLDRLRTDRAATARRLAQRVASGEARPEWQATVAGRLAKVDAQIETLTALIAQRRRWAFADDEVEYLHDTIEDYVAELQWLAEYRIPEIRRRAAWADELGKPLSQANRDLWQEAIGVAACDKPYGNLKLAIQPGLVPLGADRDSGLLEFAHHRSGRIPKRDADGKLMLDAESALVFVLIPGGTPIIGAQTTNPSGANFDEYAAQNELSPKKVQLDPFLLSKFEMTHAQWTRLATGLDVYHRAAHFEGREGFEVKPIARVSWVNCQRLCTAKGLLLPTESQWEYACRAGSPHMFWTGEEAQSLDGKEHVDDRNAGRVSAYAMAPNPFGLHNMAGNVQEWCRDPFIDRGWQSAPGDGVRSGTPDGDHRAIRGGLYTYDAWNSRPTARNTSSARDEKEIIGLRPAMRLVPAND
ncbi:MAG: bifunctional serine/threonine-protein kinase/formylglycine-generating enzyme family protein [Planctomycetota bacterium]